MLKSNVRLFSLLSSVLIAGSFLGGCKTSTSPENSGTTSQNTIVFGQITDESGAPIAGSAVTSSSVSGITDAHGYFMLNNVSVVSGRCLVKASKNGYLSSFRSAATSGGFAQAQLTLLTDATYKKDAGSNSTTILPEGGSIQLTANSVIQNGHSYTGEVDIHARYSSPTLPGFYGSFPGDMSAVESDGSSAYLYSYGILNVTLTTPAGAALQLASGTTATLTFPIAASQLASAPTSIPLWYFSDSAGLWIEEGTAQKTGSNYVGQVSHFSIHNIDKTVHPAFIFGRVLCDTIPVAGVPVQVGQSIVMTDYRGVYKSFTPAGVDVPVTVAPNARGLKSDTVVVHNPINNQDYGADLHLAGCASIMGTLVGCDGKPTNGVITATWATNGFSSIPASGAFTFNVPSGVPITLKTSSGQTSVVPALSLFGSKNIGLLSDCVDTGGARPGITITCLVDGVAQTNDPSITTFGIGNYLSLKDTLIFDIFFQDHSELDIIWSEAAKGTYPTLPVSATAQSAMYYVPKKGAVFECDGKPGHTGTLTIDSYSQSDIVGSFDFNAADINNVSAHVYHITGKFYIKRP